MNPPPHPRNPPLRTIPHRLRAACACLLATLMSGCGGPLLEVTLVDERTALENQVLGSYTELNQEVMLLASVRGIDPQGKLVKKNPLAPNQKNVVRALQRTAFNHDDLERYKQAGVIGENNLGGVTLLNPAKLEAKQQGFVSNLVAEENADREVIMTRLIDTDETLTAQDLPRVRTAFATMNRDKAPAGVMIQLKDGSWRAKEKTATTPPPP
ncbi:MAG: DUF1318 domain-containing protein [Magnetococcales bacterium]|nr:DUF1318 domain-containing protein [Magnetococcales bacterium]